ncbi:MAG: hypothetical protein WC428_08015 [Candidatus Paceibacterota bacterium]|jgi:hypothetical protein
MESLKELEEYGYKICLTVCSDIPYSEPEEICLADAFFSELEISARMIGKMLVGFILQGKFNDEISGKITHIKLYWLGHLMKEEKIRWHISVGDGFSYHTDVVLNKPTIFLRFNKWLIGIVRRIEI